MTHTCAGNNLVSLFCDRIIYHDHLMYTISTAEIYQHFFYILSTFRPKAGRCVLCLALCMLGGPNPEWSDLQLTNSLLLI